MLRTALSLADHPQLHLLLAGAHIQLTLAAVGVAVAAANGLVGLDTLGRAHALTALGVTDRPEGAVGARFIWREKQKEGSGLTMQEFMCVCVQPR